MSKFNEDEFLAQVNGAGGDNTEAVHEATRQKTPEELRSEVAELVKNSPSRRRARFNPDFTLTDEYKRMVEAGESTIAYQKYGSFTDKERQELIDHSLAIPLSESVKLRDSLLAEIQSLEDQIDNYSKDEAQAEVDRITEEFKERAKGLSRSAKAQLKGEYDEAVDKVELDLLVKPKNDLKVKRYEAIEKYKVYENRIRLYVSCNRNAIKQRLDEARNREIDENILALAEYIEYMEESK